MRCADHHWLQDALWRGHVVYTKDTEKFIEIKKEIHRTRAQEQLEDKPMKIIYKNSILKYIVLQDPWQTENNFPNIESNKTSPEIQNKSSPDMNGHYIRVLSGRNEGNVILTVVSVIFALMISGMYSTYIYISYYSWSNLTDTQTKRSELNNTTYG